MYLFAWKPLAERRSQEVTLSYHIYKLFNSHRHATSIAQSLIELDEMVNHEMFISVALLNKSDSFDNLSPIFVTHFSGA